MRLCVNVDHVATLRQARLAGFPDPVAAAELSERAGAHGIVVHLREDRRHIQEADFRKLRNRIHVKLNLEMATAEEVVLIALDVRPDQATLVPERRQELTTEGGLDVRAKDSEVGKVVRRLGSQGIAVSLFVDASKEQMRAARDVGGAAVEINTGPYSEVLTQEERTARLAEIRDAAEFARSLGLRVYAGHGLNYDNVRPVTGIPGIEELNIGHSIVARAVLVGMERAVREMLALLPGD